METSTNYVEEQGMHVFCFIYDLDNPLAPLLNAQKSASSS